MRFWGVTFRSPAALPLSYEADYPLEAPERPKNQSHSKVGFLEILKVGQKLVKSRFFVVKNLLLTYF